MQSYWSVFVLLLQVHHHPPVLCWLAFARLKSRSTYVSHLVHWALPCPAFLSSPCTILWLHQSLVCCSATQITPAQQREGRKIPNRQCCARLLVLHSNPHPIHEVKKEGSHGSMGSWYETTCIKNQNYIFTVKFWCFFLCVNPLKNRLVRDKSYVNGSIYRWEM